MLNIAVCDNIRSDRNVVKQALEKLQEKWNTEFQVTIYSNSQKLCNKLDKKSYDIIILDTDMKKIDGYQAAKIILSKSENVLLIFVASNDTNIKELVDMQIIAFLDKPLEFNQFENAITKGYNILKS